MLPRKSDHKRTKKHAVRSAAPRFLGVLTGTDLMEWWGLQPTAAGGNGKSGSEEGGSRWSKKPVGKVWL